MMDAITTFVKTSVPLLVRRYVPEDPKGTAYAIISHMERAHRHNQLEEFTARQVLVQRILATSSSCASITLCVLGMYCFLAIDPRRLIFRHQLIFFLLFFDLLKAVILLLYPTRVLTQSTAYYNDRFCQVVGFFTATAIEGADIAILSFAIHTYLLIFNPGLATKVKNSSRTEGGLYRYRYVVYGLSLVIPLVLASLAFIKNSGDSGYTSLVCWCYLPEKPVWYRLVLSWVPRWCIIVIIFVIYCLIYFHVIREFKTLGGVFTTLHKPTNNTLRPHPSHNQQPTFISAFRYFLDRALPKWIIPEPHSLSTTSTNRSQEGPHGHSSSAGDVERNKPKEAHLPGAKDDDDDEEEDDSQFTSSPIHVDTENIVFDPELHAANLEKFRKRQRIIEKQMKSIFIYPFAYCFVWLFPFILYVTQINYEEIHGPIYWMNCMGAFMQPFNGFVDTLVFFYREQPWKYTIERNFEKEHKSRMDNMVFHNKRSNSVARHENDSESIATSARLTKGSRAASMGLIDIKEYPKWRQWLSSLRLPLFRLPNEESVAKFQMHYMNKKLSTVDGDEHTTPTKIGAPADAPFDGVLGNNHDFSDVLSGDLNDTVFRTNLEKFSLNFSGKESKRPSISGAANSSRKNSIISSAKSARSRQVSAVDSPDPILVEGRKTSYPNSLPVNIELKPMNNRRNTTPKRTHGSISSSGPAEDDDMDFLEFLRKGP